MVSGYPCLPSYPRSPCGCLSILCKGDIMSRKWTQRIGRNLIFPYCASLAGLSVRRREISLLLTERIISSTQLYRWSAYNTPFHKQLATCTDRSEEHTSE